MCIYLQGDFTYIFTVIDKELGVGKGGGEAKPIFLMISYRIMIVNERALHNRHRGFTFQKLVFIFFVFH